jgi:hypothetical protein
MRVFMAFGIPKSSSIDFSQLKTGDILYERNSEVAFTVTKITNLYGIEHLQLQNTTTGSELILSRHGVALKFEAFPNISSETGIERILKWFT